MHSLQAGGMERVMTELACYFAENTELHVDLVLYGIRRDIFFNLHDGITVHRPPFPFKDQQRLFSTLKTFWFLRRKIRELRPDTVLSFGEYWNTFVLLATYRLGIPVYVSDRSQPDKSIGRLHEFLRKVLYPTAAGVIAQTIKAKEIFLGMYKPARMAVIGNPLRAIRANGAVARENIVLMVGRLIKSKNQEALISIFLRIGMPGWKLVLVGYDHMKQQNEQRLKTMVRELGGEDRVVFAGKQAHVDDFYLRSKIFAFTSLSEGFPNAIGEAMSAGLPVVAYDCIAGPAEMIEDGKNGFLVPLNDERLFTERLEFLMRNERMREEMGAAARQSIGRFSIQQIGNQFYEFILGGSGKANSEFVTKLQTETDAV